MSRRHRLLCLACLSAAYLITMVVIEILRK